MLWVWQVHVSLIEKVIDVTVFDPYYPGEGGHQKQMQDTLELLIFSLLSTPGIHWKALKMLMDSDAPLKSPI